MSWYVTKDGKQSLGPYEDHVIIAEIQKGLTSFKINWVGSNNWRDAATHPPFAEAMRQATPAKAPANGSWTSVLTGSWTAVLTGTLMALVMVGGLFYAMGGGCVRAMDPTAAAQEQRRMQESVPRPENMARLRR